MRVTENRTLYVVAWLDPDELCVRAVDTYSESPEELTRVLSARGMIGLVVLERSAATLEEAARLARQAYERHEVVLAARFPWDSLGGVDPLASWDRQRDELLAVQRA